MLLIAQLFVKQHEALRWGDSADTAGSIEG